MRERCVLAGVVLVALVGAAPPVSQKLTDQQRKDLQVKAAGLAAAGVKARQLGKLAEAVKAVTEELAILRALHNGDHPDVARSLGHLGNLLKAQRKLTEADSHFRDSLAMLERLHLGDQAGIAVLLSDYGDLLFAQGKLSEAEAYCRDSLKMHKRLHKGDHPSVVIGLNNLGGLLKFRTKFAEAELHLREAISMTKRLFEGDHAFIAASLANLGALFRDQGNLAEAETFQRDALAMMKRLNMSDQPNVAQTLINMARLLHQRRKLKEAEPYYRDALAMYTRLHNGDHPDIALSRASLTSLLRDQGKFVEAERLLRDALTMRKRLHKGDHPDVALSTGTLGVLLKDQGKLTEAEPFLRDALAMYKRLFKNDSGGVARSLNNLGMLLSLQGKLAEAESHLCESLAILKRLHKGGHSHVAGRLNGLGAILHAQGKLPEAESHQRDALVMYRQVADEFADQHIEGETLTLITTQPLARDGFLSVTRERHTPPTPQYIQLWTSKGALARLYQRRHLSARAAATNPKASALLAELAEARRRRAELLLTPQFRDLATRNKRDGDLQALADRIAELDRDVRPLLTTINRADQLNNAAPADLQKLLPPGGAVIDFLAYTFFEYDKNQPAKYSEKRTPSYLAFVLTRDKVARVELGETKAIEDAVRLWRDAITSSKEIPADIPTRVRSLVWEKVRKELPPSVKTLYLSPDMALTQVPWQALPGDRPGTILLEDFALAVVPHAPFLLDKLWPDDTAKKPDTLVSVGGVSYADAPATKPDIILTLKRSGPAVNDGQRFEWKALEGAAAEAKGVAAVGVAGKLAPHLLSGKAASADRVLAELPKARFAHLATHGFFADASFRSVLQVDPKLFEMRGGERVGAGALSPMVMSGLVLAGANRPDTPGRGLLTGETLIDRDLSGLELAVLSACETGLGDVAGGEGVFGLQRAFHVAGTRNVVASLWKVDDDATAALMAVFYKKLWQENLPPIEALRQAQLHIYRNPGEVARLAKTLRGKFEVVPGSGATTDPEPKPDAGGKAHPRLWAAFTLSGPGTLAPAEKGKP